MRINHELERTEELMVVSRSKNSKKKTIIIITTIAIIAAGAGIFAGLKIYTNSQIKSALNSAQKKIAESDYDAAIAAYDKVLEIDDSNSSAYEGRGDAYQALGKPQKALADYVSAKENDKGKKSPYVKAIRTAAVLKEDKKSNELVKEMRKNVEGMESATVGSVLMGCTPENLAADGIVCETEDGVYIANKPKNGDISFVDNDGKEKHIFTYKKDKDVEVNGPAEIYGINVMNGWVYYRATIGKKGEDETSIIRKVRIDGNDDTSIDNTYNVYGTLVIGDKLFYTYYERGTQANVLCVRDIKGHGFEKIDEVEGAITSNGEKLFYMSAESDPEDEEGFGSIYSLKEYDLKTKEINEVEEYPTEKYQYCKIIYSDNAVFYNINENIYRYDLKTRDIDGIMQFEKDEYINMSVCKDKLYYYETDFNDDMSGQKLTKEGTYSSYINVFDLVQKREVPDENLELSLTGKELNMRDEEENSDEFHDIVWLSNICCVKDRMYYSIDRQVGDYRDLEKAFELSKGMFGNMDMKGEDNQLYGY